MAKRWSPARRRFLEAAAAAAAVSTAACNREASRWRTFSMAEAEVAAAICECLIPTDELPGAAWAGAVNYIDTQLAGQHRKQRRIYAEGLAAIGRAALALHGAGFATLPAGRQVELLEQIEKGALAGESWKPADQKRFFAAILAHTMQSYYGDPRHGGNRDSVGYRSIGLSTTPVRGRSQHDLTTIGNTRGGL